MVSRDAGQPFGRYQIVRRLGEGGMAEVFLARDVLLDRKVAIKRLLPHLAADPDAVAMFLDEARAIASLKHPNIVDIYDLGTEDGRHFLAMEWLSGWTLAQVAGDTAATASVLPATAVLPLVVDAARALHAAHTAWTHDGAPLRLIHRDVSPQNLFVTKGGVLKLLDFGIAKSALQRRHTRAGQIKGKWCYMSPEQCRGEPLDARSDVFSLGVVLHELLAGRRLFTQPTPMAIADAIIRAPILPPARADGEALPMALIVATMRALEQDRALRDPSAGAMADALERAARAVGAWGDAREVAACLERLGERTSLVKRLDADARTVEALDSVVADLADEQARGAAVSADPTAVEASAWAAPTLDDGRGAPVSVPASRSSRPWRGTEELEAAGGAGPVSAPRSWGHARALWTAVDARSRRGWQLLAAAVFLAAVALGALVVGGRRPPTAVGAPPRAPAAAVGGGVALGVAEPALPSLGAEGDREPQPAVTVEAPPETEVGERPRESSKGKREVGFRPRGAAGARGRVKGGAAAVDAPAVDAAPVQGKLTLQAVPWANVYIRGRLVGPTPLINYPVPAGDLEVRLVNPDAGLSVDKVIVVPPGGVVKERVELSR
ncbi:MAG: serine/threonine protein kinase [Deltaproteobacteria bacterium]|nr:serine/threonine protein kinase [Deltaproteobacteria bacterium]